MRPGRRRQVGRGAAGVEGVGCPGGLLCVRRVGQSEGAAKLAVAEIGGGGEALRGKCVAREG